MPLIILDGPDCCGKSTLARKFYEKHPDKTSITHLSYRMAGNMDLYHLASMVHAVRRQPNQLHILDRSWISEEVYGQVYRSGPEHQFFNRMIHRIALKYSAVYILCVPSDLTQYLDFYYSQYKDREEMYPMDNNVGRVWDCFQSIVTGNSKEKLQGYSGFLKDNKTTLQYYASPHWIVYDMFNNSAEQTVDNALLLQADLFYRQLRQFNSPKNQNGGGHLYGAKMLILGDRANGVYHRCAYPFVGMGPSETFLSEQLDLAEIAEEEVIWMNVNLPNGKPDPRLSDITNSLSAKSKPPIIVAMGKEADTAIRNIGNNRLDVCSLNSLDWYVTFKRTKDLLAQTLWQIKEEASEPVVSEKTKVYTH